MANKVIRVGFDLDGVILYNPIRTFRPIAAFFKPFFFRKNSNNFYFPKTSIEKVFWTILHSTSYCISPGYNELIKISKLKKIELYIITARYSFLKKEFVKWIKKLNALKYFKGCYFNKNDLQPNEFKHKMIIKLKLDIFVEDNWGVIQKLNGDIKKIKVLWITNWLDQFIQYQYKFSSLSDVSRFLAKLIT